MSSHRIAVIPGDGIGPEIMPEGLRVLDAVGRKFGIGFTYDHFDWCSRHYVRHGTMMPPDWKEQIGGHDAIYFGAVGAPDIVADHTAVWESLIKIRLDAEALPLLERLVAEFEQSEFLEKGKERLAELKGNMAKAGAPPATPPADAGGSKPAADQKPQ